MLVLGVKSSHLVHRYAILMFVDIRYYIDIRVVKTKFNIILGYSVILYDSKNPRRHLTLDGMLLQQNPLFPTNVLN